VIRAPSQAAGKGSLLTGVRQWTYLARVLDSLEGRIRKIAIVDNDLRNMDPTQFGAPSPDGFLSAEGLSAEQLGGFINRVLADELPMPAELSRSLLNPRRPLSVRPGERSVILTPREQATLALLVDGMSNKQVAAALGISLHGAKRLVTAVLLKLGVPNRTAAVVVALKSELV
jgi:DNA-binding NarL/FixJ family response regulator